MRQVAVARQTGIRQMIGLPGLERNAQSTGFAKPKKKNGNAFKAGHRTGEYLND
jgi:hypothetical protein